MGHGAPGGKKPSSIFGMIVDCLGLSKIMLPPSGYSARKPTCATSTVSAKKGFFNFHRCSM